MDIENRYKIFSEDYMNLLIDYRANPRALDRFSQESIHIINEGFAVVYLPITEVEDSIIALYGYSAIPNLLGLASEIAIEASGVEALRNVQGFNLRGNGVLIGIIDTGINYSLPFFRNEDGTTRIVSLWDQTIQSDNFPEMALFGTEYERDQINQALQSENPLEVVPSVDDNGHGTMLAAIAGGTESPAEDFYSPAPESEFVVVKLSQAKSFTKNFYAIREDAVCYQEDLVMWGLQYCEEISIRLNRPIAICLGIGTSLDSHDGKSPLASFVSILAGFPRIGVVTPAGNEGNMGRHFRGVIDPSVGSTVVELNVGESDNSFSMQLWGNPPGIFTIDILSPSGEFIPRLAASMRASREIAFIFEATVIQIDFQTIESQTGDQVILLRFRDVSAGVWRFTVYGQGDLSLGFHIWLPMGDMISRGTYFVQPDIFTTLLSPGTAQNSLCVTAYNPITNTLFVNASRGYTRVNAIKPEIAAPGVNYLAPDATGQTARRSGTGVAAAHTAGVMAILLEWGVVQGNSPNMSTLEIKGFLIRGARRSPNLRYPNREWGFGILDIYNTFNVFRAIL